MNYSNEFNNGEIKNIKTFSGPIEWVLLNRTKKELIKSVYNTIEGQKLLLTKIIYLNVLRNFQNKIIFNL